MDAHMLATTVIIRLRRPKEVATGLGSHQGLGERSERDAFRTPGSEQVLFPACCSCVLMGHGLHDFLFAGQAFLAREDGVPLLTAQHS